MKKQHLFLLLFISFIFIGCQSDVSSAPSAEVTPSPIVQADEVAPDPIVQDNDPSSEIDVAPELDIHSYISSGIYNIDDIDFTFYDNVRNDVTMNWRLSLISASVQPTDYAMDYYNQMFSSEDEIHAIINFAYNTTTKISFVFGMLDITTYDYVAGEEHDANLLFTGNLLSEYMITLDTGEVEQIQ